MNEAGQYPCDKCDKQFSYRHNLYRHIGIAHEGIKFPCAVNVTTKLQQNIIFLITFNLFMRD